MAKKKAAAKKKAPAKKKVVKSTSENRSSFISKAPVRRLMKGEGAGLVSDEAVKLLIEQLEKNAIQTTKKALTLVKDEKRKRLTAEDITWATR
ncbi:hypothetical protein NEF87_003938 [Candidatus Lokiarchaeum ossiferum]|uniref:Transcription factor CBF/NF-Y/archaeal histone domain-containing protein n=1 Tax=Candidatus Lokiarchaeum ossiferum TaxID=2951803 RepID=A0ABY6HVU2_9ARCH|nr:hypothetical protein NEF87_003938 [Candidatus Lokiarchaeum sp. B-35]